ncbi:hypothetical protein COCNU_08G001480 [Cocos nucifera]|uniref:Uncharacterized protein n=1 Tax=Cocos nucifera TaxID=13894 RepID=A0A8K0IHG5_COCNU|nr:hypothetical protein COCNU_08G001480 [Cocos nucifera]
MNVADMAAGLVEKAATEMVLAVSPVRAIMETIGSLFEGMIETMGMAELLGTAEAIEAIDPSGQKIPISDMQPAEVLDLEALHGFMFSELKKLLSEQILFNVGLNRVSPEGKNLSPPKALDPKTLRKRKADTIGGRSTHAWIKFLPTPPIFEIEEFNPQNIEDF